MLPAYRLIVIAFKVLFIDYGNMESVDINDAFLLKDSDLLSIPPQAIQVNVKDVTKENARLTKQQIHGLLTDQTVGAQISRFFFSSGAIPQGNATGNREEVVGDLFMKYMRVSI